VLTRARSLSFSFCFVLCSPLFFGFLERSEVVVVVVVVVVVIVVVIVVVVVVLFFCLLFSLQSFITFV